MQYILCGLTWSEFRLLKRYPVQPATVEARWLLDVPDPRHIICAVLSVTNKPNIIQTPKNEVVLTQNLSRCPSSRRASLQDLLHICFHYQRRARFVTSDCSDNVSIAFNETQCFVGISGAVAMCLFQFRSDVIVIRDIWLI